LGSLFQERSLRRDSGAAGHFHGGLGIDVQVRNLAKGVEPCASASPQVPALIFAQAPPGKESFGSIDQIMRARGRMRSYSVVIDMNT
jgi:hypothetical protein